MLHMMQNFQLHKDIQLLCKCNIELRHRKCVEYFVLSGTVPQILALYDPQRKTKHLWNDQALQMMLHSTPI